GTVGGTGGSLRGGGVRGTGASCHAARQNDDGVGGVGAAGNVGADIGIGLLLDLARGFAGSVSQDLRDKVAATAEAEFLRHNTQGAVGGNEVHGLDALIAFYREQELPQKK